MNLLLCFWLASAVALVVILARLRHTSVDQHADEAMRVILPEADSRAAMLADADMLARQVSE